MKLCQVTLINFRCYQQTTTVDFDDMTVLVGRNDAGKSALLDALNVFFGNVKLDTDDRNKHADEESEITITCEFEQAFAAGDQVAPCAVLWPDPDRLWEPVMSQLQKLIPELYALGNYAAAQRTGPALWLRCVEARVLEGTPPTGTMPVFYLPGVSREQLRAVEECPQALAALVELQFRGVVWLHPNGKEWTPYAFLISRHGGLGLDAARDQITMDALAGALPVLINLPLTQLQGRLLDAEFLNELVAPDASGLVLRWLSETEAFRKSRSEAEWKAFCQQCKADFRFDPEKDGALKAARLLADRGNHWKEVWQRFAESPANYPGVVEWLRRAAPKAPSMFDTSEVWPDLNERDEIKLEQALAALVDRPPDEVARRVADLEAHHGKRRGYPWQKLGLSPLATALGPLARTAALCQNHPGAPNVEAFGELYARDGWKVDAAALTAMAACGTQEQHGAVLGALRAVYLPWLESTARHLQQLIASQGQAIAKRGKATESAPGRLLLFADGLRLDVARRLAERLDVAGLSAGVEWDWATIPSVTASAKPAVSPVANSIQGGEAGDEFSTRLVASGQRLTQDRFVATLKEGGWQCLGPEDTGDPAGSAWTEYGTLDKSGHNDGWKLARAVETEVRDLASRIEALVSAGWREVVVITDHGWLLMPGGLPKIELKAFLTEHRWGRCASMKSEAVTDLPTFKWYWNPGVSIATPPGVGCFRAAMEYSHGGVSLQEMVIPRIVVSKAQTAGNAARLLEAKWTAARCRVSIGGNCAGTRVDVRTRPADAGSSLLANKQPQEVKTEGKVTVFLEQDTDIGRDAEIVLLDASGQVIGSLPTKIGE